MKLDKLDLEIISLIQKDDHLTHSQIAQIVKRSQPTIGMRIKKLEEKGLLKFQPGINFKHVELFLIMVNLETKKPEEFMEMTRNCPFMINAFRMSGKYGITLLLASSRMKKLYNIVNTHFRDNPDVQKVSMEFITDFANDFVLPINNVSEVINPDLEETCCNDCDYCQDRTTIRF